ncbi:MAG: hypothetical protein KC543_10035 [Myxococcales bacterium]|nr:hypothetical protein [Myxococcales bacterium]
MTVALAWTAIALGSIAPWVACWLLARTYARRIDPPAQPRRPLPEMPPGRSRDGRGDRR